VSTAPTVAAVPPAPSARTLVKATLGALLVAAVVLVVAVLPAEYGIDPTGAGRALGLLGLFEAGQEAAAVAAAPAIVTAGEGGPLHPQFNEYREDRREFTIAPGTGLEFKYSLNKGATMIYSWQATGFVDFDFHTEPAGKPSSASESFEKGEAVQKKGGYTAPYDGIHGWYWENKATTPVTVTLSTAGFYSRGTLFLPEERPQAVDIPERKL
jgi:hypothetical protein